MSVVDKDLGWKKILRNMRKIDAKAVKIGIQDGDKTFDGKESLAYVASLHEFGSPGGKIPERSFIRTAIDKNERKINNLSDRLALKILDGSVTVRGALDLIGLSVTGMIQEQITDGDYVPLSPATIKKKGSDKPLIDTGHMWQSVRHVIEDK
ncbi:hypothetical protein [Megamonas hypermegale]|uniref:hypothetical protein n=1 Tax=Megamonas hypermegale TaxID=158847 RepID=UPI0026EA46DD|nr:hypothetical protein [Megamonas hypermegale]